MNTANETVRTNIFGTRNDFHTSFSLFPSLIKIEGNVDKYTKPKFMYIRLLKQTKSYLILVDT